MPIQTLSPNINSGSILGQALGQGFQSGFGTGFQNQQQQLLQQQQQAQQQSQLMQAIQEAEMLPNISNQQKEQLGLLKAFSSNPNLALELMKRKEAENSDLARQQLSNLKFQSEELKAADEKNKIDHIVENLPIDDKLKGILKNLPLNEVSKIAVEYAKPRSEKEKEKESTFQSGLDILNQMRNIRKKGNIGRGSQITKHIGGETAKDFGEYEQLGKSLISLATNIPIRNRLEFETLAEKLYDPSIQDKEAEGILNAMEKIIKNNLKTSEKTNSRPPLSSFQR